MPDTSAKFWKLPLPKRSWLPLLQPFWSVIVVGLVTIFIWHQRGELDQAVRELRLADWHWLVLVMLSALVMHGFITQMLSSVFSLLGRRIPFIPALMTHAEREMLATVMPMGGAASYATIVSRFEAYGVTRNDALLAMMLNSAVGHLSLLTVAIPALILLILRHAAGGAVFIGAGLVLVFALLALLVVTVLLRGKQFPARIEARLPAPTQEFRESALAAQISARSLAVPFAYGLLGDIFGVLSMWAALHAVRVDASFEIALAAYSVGTMLQLAAPVFQGLGIVEVSVVVLLQHLGVPASQAIGAALLYRFVDVWLPVILGIGVHARYQKTLRGLPAYLPAISTALSGLLALASVLPARVHVPFIEFRRATGWGPLHQEHANRTFTLIVGFLLLILSLRLLRRQHAAWLVALGLSSLLTVIYLSRDYDDIGAIFSGTNIVILLIYRSRFRTRSDIPTLRRGVYVLLTSFSATYLFGVLSLWLADRRHFGEEFSIGTSIRTAADIYLGFGDGGLTARTARGEWIIDSMHLLCVLSIVVSALAILQPFVWRHAVQRAETERARQMIEQFGTSSLDRFKYWPDKFQFFASDGGGVVSFGLSGRTALVLGDPTAQDEGAFVRTLDEFLEFCAVNGWEPAFHQAPAGHLEAYRRRGFTAVLIGREAVVDLNRFSLSGKSMGGLRSTRNRAQRDGRVVVIFESPLSDMLVAELNEISNEWLTLEGRRERSFTLGYFDPQYMRESSVLVLRSVEGRAEAFINLIPDGAPGELTFDLMRHRVDAPNGSMDLLMLALIDLGVSKGYSALSLGMVPFLSPRAYESLAATDRAIAQLVRPMGRFFASQSLFAYKDKFHPAWEPRFLVVKSVAQLPRVALALARLSEMDDRGSLRRFDPRRPKKSTQVSEPVELPHQAGESVHAR